MKLKRLLAAVIVMPLVLIGYSNSNDNNESKRDDADNGKKQEIQVAATASLMDVTRKLAPESKKEYRSANIKFNYGGSGALRKRIEPGAPVDVFMSANTKDVDALKGKNKAHDIYKYVKNNPVLTGDKDSNYTLVKDLKDSDKLTLGEAKIAPAGKYTEQYLDNNNLFKEVESKIVYAKDVKQVLNYVEKGSVKQGFVYKINLYKQNKKVDTAKVTKEVELKRPITYEAGVTPDSKLARGWMEFSKSDKAKEILKEYHFAA